jgi:hypothetical protein
MFADASGNVRSNCVHGGRVLRVRSVPGEHEYGPEVFMFCPRCGQHASSPETRFCARCGFNLASVERFIATGGLVEAEPGDVTTPRQRGMRIGAKFLFASVVLFPVVFALGIGLETPAPLVLSAVLFLLGASRMMYARLFEDHRVRPALDRPPTAAELPAYQQPAGTLAQGKVTTGKLEPPSVTEHTTRFLDQ